MITTTFSPSVTRFAWKEYRTLRAVWLAVLVVGVLVQLISLATAAPGTVLPPIMLGLSLGACILYVVAAAAILFSVEHEEETYQFLSGLPIRWRPMTIGKLLVAIGSTLALAAALIAFGWAVAGCELPAKRVTGELVALLGVGILEALAWATLFSFLVKRPLTAVALALVVGTLVVQLASATMASRPDGLTDLVTYSRAVPLRLAIVFVVSAGIVLVARRWLAAEPRVRTVELPLVGDRIVGVRTQIAQAFSPSVSQPGVSHVAMLTRLLWHAWRQSWKSLFIPFAVTAGLWGVALLTALPPQSADNTVSLGRAGALILPALFGALVFSGDQRNRQFRYLAEHAARPRYVWLTRQLIWLGTLFVASLGFALVASLYTAFLVNSSMQAQIEHPSWFPPEPLMSHRTFYFVSSVGLMGFGALAAYAVGQLCSMVLRSEIIAAFLSVLLSVLITAWALVLVAWFLSGWWFLFPIVAGLLLATWLRAPDWIIERNSWRAWLKPMLAVAVPIMFVGILLPRTRLDQVPGRAAEIEPLITAYRAGDTAEARQTAAMYEHAIALRDSWEEANLLERWSGPEFAEDGSRDALGRIGRFGDVDEMKIPYDQLEEYYAAVDAQRKLQADAWTAAKELAVEASLRPSCRFDFDWSSTTIPTLYDSHYTNRDAAWRRVHSNFDSVLQLAERTAFAFFPDRKGAYNSYSLDGLAAALRICEHLRQGQPTAAAARTFTVEKQILRAIPGWAQRDGVTKDQLLNLMDQLELHFERSSYNPEMSLVADHLLVRDVLEDQAPPLVLDQRPIPWSVYLAYLANQLPWERERAIKALDVITLQNVGDLNQLQEFFDGRAHFSRRHNTLRRWLRSNYWPEWSPVWLSKQFLASTSYLTRFEYEERVPINEFYAQWAKLKASRRALVIQLALLVYYRDHGKYPAALSELVPDYLNKLPLDPYSGQPFYYSPGLELPLRPNSYTDYESVPPHTPVVWSVGPNAVQLTRYETSQVIRGDDQANDQSVEPTKVNDSAYTLLGSDGRWDGENELVFPLLK